MKQGLRERVPDERDFSLGSFIDWPKLSDLPEEYWCPPLSIKNQLVDNNEDFCASCAGVGMIEPKEEAILYYPYLFAAAKYESEKDPDSWGLQLKEVGKALTKWGCPELKDIPESVLNLTPKERRRFENYPDNLKELAKKHRAKSYFFIEGPYDAYDRIRATLWYFREKKQKVMIGLVWGWPLSQFSLEGTPKGFGHALYVSGWYKDGLRVVNSAGETAGINGQHKLSRETINHYADKYGIMTIVDVDRNEAEYRLSVDAHLEDNWLILLLRALVKPFKELCNR